MHNTLLNKIGAACLNLALSATSISAIGAANTYYRTRKGAYGRNQQYLAETGLTPFSTTTFFDRAKHSLTEGGVIGEESHEFHFEKGQKVKELLIVDGAVQNKSTFFNQAKPGLDVVEIGDGGLVALMETLSRYKGLDAVHIVSHAQPGAMQLGGELLDAEAFESNLSSFAALNGAIKAGGDLMLYGCELAQGQKGEDFLELIQANTHADLAASVDRTGGVAYGANWDLEIHKGDIEAQPLPESMALKDFTGLLLPPFSGTIDFANYVALSGGYTATYDAQFTESGYTLEVDGNLRGTTTYGGLDYVYTYSGGGLEDQVTLFFTGSETFNATSVYIYNRGTGATFYIDSDLGDMYNSGSGYYLSSFTGSTFTFSGFTGVSQLIITASSAFDIRIDDLAVTALAGADTDPPALSGAASVNVTPVTEANVGNVGFTITLDFDEPMDTGVDPSIAFDQTVSGTLTLDNETVTDTETSEWTTAQQYVARYDVTDGNEALTNIGITVTNARDVAGNTMASDATNTNLFSIDNDNPALSGAASVNVSTVTESENGNVGFTITLDFDETMNTGVAPAIAFDQTVSGTLTLDNETVTDTETSEWTSGTQYVARYDVADGDEALTNIGITVTNAQDANGNVMASDATNTNLFSIDNDNPALSGAASVNVSTVTESENGNVGFTITLDFDETMNTGVDPSIAFDQTVSGTLALDNETVTDTETSEWTSGTQYVARYDVADGDEALTNIGITVTNAQDANGNVMASDATNTNLFSIDNENPALSGAASVSVSTVTESENGNVGFTITLDFDETMNTGVDPSIAFDQTVSGTLTLDNETVTDTETSEWTSGTQYVARYDVVDGDEALTNIGITVTNAQDANGNVMASDATNTNLFSIDNENPALSGAATVNVATITESEVGNVGFTITLDFDEPMNTGVAPSIAFDQTVSGTLTLDDETVTDTETSEWTSGTQYVARYDVVDADETISNVGITVTNAQDAGGNVMASDATNTNLFSITTNVDTDPPALSGAALVNVSTVTESENGNVGFTITLNFDEPMDTGIDPNIAFDQTVSGTLTLDNETVTDTETSEWLSATQYVARYDVVDGDEAVTNIGITVTLAEDVAGNVMLSDATNTNLFSIDNDNPALSGPATVNVGTVTESELGNVGFTITLDFDEPMNTGVAPSIAFDQTVSGTLTLDNETVTDTETSEWTSTTQYVARYDVADGDEVLTNIGITVSNAQDAGGNVMGSDLTNTNLFNIDNENPALSGAATVNVSPITESEVGNVTFTITLDFDQTMNTGVDPSIAFDQTVSGTLTLDNETVTDTETSEWTSGTQYVARYDVVDGDEALTNIGITVTNAQDANGNAMASDATNTNLFSIDNENPALSGAATVNVSTVTEAEVGNVGFTITLDFDEPMNTGVAPSIAFDQTVSGTLTLDDETGIDSETSEWLSATQYVARYDVVDGNETLNNIGITVTNAQDAGGNVMASDATNTNLFDIDNVAPTAAITRLTPTVENTVASSVTFRVTFSEDVQNVGTADFDVDNGSISGEVLDNLNPQSASVYDVTVDSYTGTGDVDLDFAGGVTIDDLAGNAFAGTVTTDETYTIVTPDTDSDIIEQVAFVFVEPINPTTASTANGTPITGTGDRGVLIAGFTVRDGGASSPDTDDASTTLTDVQLDITNHDNLNRVALFDGSTFLAEAEVTGSAVSFSSLTIVAADDGTQDFEVYATFKDDGTVADQDVLDISISAANVTALAGGSDFTAFGTVSTSEAGDENLIEVDFANIFYIALDTTVSISSNFNVTVAAQDADGNTDTDFADDLTISKDGGSANSGTLSSVTGLTQTPTAGQVAYTDLQIDDVGTFTLNTISAAPSSLGPIATVTMTATDASTDVVPDPSFMYETDIDYTLYQATEITPTAISGGDALLVARFLVRDGGAGGDNDGLGVFLDCSSCANSEDLSDGDNGFTIQVTSGGANIRRIALYTLNATDEVGADVRVGEYANTGDNIYTFNLDDDNGNFGNNNDYIISAGGTGELGVYVSFETDVTDNEQIEIQVTNVFHRTSQSGTSYSDFAFDNGAELGSGGVNPESSTAGDDNRIEVTATDLEIDSGDDPSSTTIERETGFSITLNAIDANSNIDLDETSDLAASFTTAGDVPLDVDIETFTGSLSLTNGSTTLTNVVVDTANIAAFKIVFDDDDAGAGNDDGNTLTTVTATDVDIDDTINPSDNTLTPNDEATNVSLTGTIEIDMSETVLPDVGQVIVVRDEVPSTNEIFDAVDLTYSGSTVTIPSSALESGDSYYVYIEADAFQDVGGNNFAGFENNSSWNFTAETVLALLDATNNGNTEIILTFNEDAVINLQDATEFTIVDSDPNGPNTFNPAVATAITDLATDTELELAVPDLSTAVGDLFLSYNAAGGSEIEANADGSRDLGNITSFQIDFDQDQPTMASAALGGVPDSEITITFDDEVQIVGSNPGDFTVTDGVGMTYTVDGISDGAVGDTDITITMSGGGLTSAIGDITVDYTDNNGEVFDYGENVAATGSVVIDLDMTAPDFSSANVVSGTRIDVTFDEDVQIVDGDPSGDFLVTDGFGNTYEVSQVVDGTPQDADLELTSQDFSAAIGDLTVSYTNTATDYQDFGGNSLANGNTTIDTDNTAPNLSSAVDNNGSTSITLVFDEEVQITTTEGNDFTVTDGLMNTYAVGAGDIAAGSADNELDLTVADYSGAVGDLTITYDDDDDAGDIEDYGSNFFTDDLTGVTIDFDQADPTMVSAARDGGTSNTLVNVTFDDAVQDAGSAVAGDFTVTDGIGATFTVTNLDFTNGNSGIIQLTVNTFAAATGDLTVTYANSGGGGNSIDDFGGNTFQDDAVGVSVERDAVAPTMASASRVNNTTIDVTFDDAMQVVDADPAGEFIVADGFGNTYSVSAVEDDVANDAILRLTVQTMASSVGDITITYSNTATDYQDFGGNSLITDLTGVVIDDDAVAPTLSSAVDNNGSTSITLVFDEEVQITTTEGNDFTVTDGLMNAYAIAGGGIAAGSADNELDLTVANYSGAVGDLTITYDDDDDAGDIEDYGSNFFVDDLTGVTIDFDQANPTMVSAARDGGTSNTLVNVTFDDAVQDAGSAVAADFTVTDGIGATFTVTNLDFTNGNSGVIQLTVNTFAAATGDLTVTYANSGGGGNSIDDFGGNTFQDDAVGVSVERDAVAPTMASASRVNNTTIDITFDDAMQVVDADPAGEFIVTDGKGNTYAVSSVTDNIADDAILRLTVQTMASSVGDITVTYSNSATDYQDFGGNSLITDLTGVVIDDDAVAPDVTITKNAVTSGTTDFTNDDAVSYSIVFTEEIDPTTFTATDDLVLTGGATFTPINDGDLTTADNINYTLAVSGVAGDGNLNIAFNGSPASTVTDYGSNNLNAISLPTDFTIDNTGPVASPVSIGVWNGAAFAGVGALVDDSVGLTITVNEALAAAPTTETAEFRSGGGLTNDTLHVDVSGLVYTISYVVSDLDNSGSVTFTVDLEDVAGNTTEVTATTDASGVNVDAEEPTLDSFVLNPLPASSGTSSATNTDSLNFTLTFSEVVDPATISAGVLGNGDDIRVDTTGVFVNTITLNNQGGGVWELILDDITDGDSSTGTIVVTVIDDTIDPILDGVGNDLSGSGTIATSETITIDQVAPGITLTRNAVTSGVFTGTRDNSVSFDIAFSNSVATSITTGQLIFDETDITLNADPGLTLGTTTLAPDGDNINWTYVVPITSGDGNISITIGDQITDDAENQIVHSVGSSTTSNTFTIDNTQPSISSVGLRSTNMNSHAAVGDSVFLDFTLDATLAVDPTVEFRSGGGNINDVGGVVLSNTGLVYTARYRVDAADTEGDVTFSILNYEDPAGNVGTLVSTVDDASEVEVDINVPILTSVSLVTDNATDDQHALETDTVFLSFTVDDMLAAAPVVSFSSGGTGVTGVVVIDTVSLSETSSSYIAKYEVAAFGSDDDGAVTFNISFTDDAGNAGVPVTAVTDASAVEVDNTAPTLGTSVTIASDNVITDHASAGDNVTLSFTSDDELSADPVVSMSISGTSSVGGVTVNNVGGNDYEATFRVDGIGSVVGTDLDDEGQVTFTIDYVDDAGNAGMQVTTVNDATEVEVDFTDPTLTSVVLTTDNVTDNQHGIAGDSVRLNFTVDDTLSVAPAVVFTSGGVVVAGTVEVEIVSMASSEYVARYLVDAGDTDGQVEFEISFTDDAGNAGDEVSAITGGAEVEIDNTTPTLSGVTISSDNATNSERGVTGDLVTLNFTVNDSLASNPTVVFYSGPNGNNTDPVVVGGVAVTPVSRSEISSEYDVTYTVNAGDTDGQVSFEIDFTDDAGNAGTTVTAVSDASEVQIDNTVPALTFVSLESDSPIDSAHAAAGDNVILSFTANDELSADPVVSMSVNGTPSVGGVTVNNVGGNDYEATFRVDGIGSVVGTDLDDEGDVTFTIDYVDDAGNAGAQVALETDGTEVEVDFTDPTLTSVVLTTDNVTDIQHGITGDSVRLNFTVDDDLSAAPSVVFTSGGVVVAGTVEVDTVSLGASQYVARYLVDAGDTDGQVEFEISFADDAGNAGDEVSAITGGAEVEIDNTTPTLSVVTISSDNATNSERGVTGDLVTLNFTVNDSLASNPTVVFYSGPNGNNTDPVVVGGVAVTPVSRSEISSEYDVTYTVNAGDTDGQVSFEIDFTDDAGNAGSTVAAVSDASEVQIDNTVPALTFVSLESDSPIDSAHAAAGDNVVLSFTANDELSADPVVSMSVNGTPSVGGVTVNNVGGNDYEATFRVDGIGSVVGTDLDDEGDVTFTIDYVDDAGNAGAQVALETDGTEVEVDFTDPTLTSVVLTTDNVTDIQHGITGDSVRLNFTVNEDLSAAPSVVFTSGGVVVAGTVEVDTVSLPASQYVARYMVDAGDTDGQVEFEISFIDDAGNAGDDVTAITAGDEVEIDNTAPMLTSVSLVTDNTTDDQHAMESDTVFLSFTVDEMLSVAPAATFSSGGTGVAGVVVIDTVSLSETSSSYIAKYEVADGATDDDGLVTFSISFTDDAGNPGTPVTAVTDVSSVDVDNTAPILTGVSFNGVTELTATFNETVVANTESTAAEIDFVVKDEDGDDEFEVTGQDDGTLNDASVLLTVDDLSTAEGDVLLTYTDNSGTNGFVTDLAGNPVATLAPDTVFVDRTMNERVTINENPSTAYAEGDTDEDGVTDGTAVAMYRTTLFDGVDAKVWDPTTETPITVQPAIAGSTITIYRDPGLTDSVTAQTNVPASGWSPTIAAIMQGDSATATFGNDGMGGYVPDNDDINGVYTFYFTETAVNGTESEGPSLTYSLAFLDSINNTAQTTVFPINDNVGTELVVAFPENQNLDVDGSGALGQVERGDNGTSFITGATTDTTAVDFVPSNASQNTFQIAFEWENDSSEVSARFLPISLTVTPVVQILDDENAIHYRMDDNSVPLSLFLQDASIDTAGGVDDPAQINFYDLRVFELDGDGNEGADRTADIFSSSPTIANGDPTSILDGDWVLDPTQVATNDNDLDSLRLQSRFQTDDDQSIAPNNSIDFYLYPDPVVTMDASLDGLELQYCVDDDPIAVVDSVFVYPGFSGNSDEPEAITNGYVLEYYGADGTRSTLDRKYDFTASGTLSNEFDPGDPDQGTTPIQDPNTSGDDITAPAGYYRILYVTDSITDALVVNDTISYDFEVMENAPRPTIEAGDLTNRGGLNGDIYLLEFVDGDLDVSTDAINSLDAVTSNSTTPGVEPIQWHTFETGGSALVTSSTINLKDDVYNGNNPGAGTQTIYIEDRNFINNASVDISSTFDGCLSIRRQVDIVIYPVPQEPQVDIDVDGVNEEDLSTSDGVFYIFEYCEGDAVGDVTFTNDISDNRAHFVLISEDKTDTTWTDSNTLDWSADIFSGGTEADTTIYMVTITEDSTFALGNGAADAFQGAVSDTTTVELSIFTDEVKDVIDQENDLQDNIFFTEYFTCQSDAIEAITTNNVSADGDYFWYADDGDLMYEDDGSDTLIVQSTTLRNVDLVDVITAYQSTSGGTTTTETYTTEEGVDGTAGIYYFWVTQRRGGSTNTDFPGCESTAVLISITVFPSSDAPLFSLDGGTTTNAVTGNNQGSDFELFYDADELTAAVDFTAVLNGFSNADFTTEADESDTTAASRVIHEFNWYASNEDRDINAQVTSGATVSAQQLGLVGFTEDDTVHIYLEQVTSIVRDVGGNELFSGCVSEGVVIRFNIIARPEAPTGTTSLFYCEGEAIDDLAMTGEENAVFTYLDINNNVLHTEIPDSVNSNGDGVSLAELDSELGIGSTPVDSVYTIKVVQTTDTTSTTGDGAEGLNLPFGGASSDTTIITIDVREVPVAVQLNAGSSYCDDDVSQLSIGYTDDGNADFFIIYQGDGVTREDTLSGATSNILFGLDQADFEAGIDSTIFISQVSFSNIDATFSGCESPLASIDVNPNPRLEVFTGGNLFVNQACGDGSLDVEVNVTNLGGLSQSDYTVDWLVDGTARTESDNFNLSVQDGTRSGTLGFDVTVSNDQTDCETTFEQTIVIGVQPQPNVEVALVTDGANSRFEITDGILTEEQMRTVELEVRNARNSNVVYTETLTDDDDGTLYAEFAFDVLPGAGIYDALIVSTSESGCIEGDSLRFTIVPQVTVTGDTVITFDRGRNLTWYTDFDRLAGAGTTTWEIAAPAGSEIDEDADGNSTNVWVTNASGIYDEEEISYVYSPSFDLTGIPLPAVSFDYYLDMANAADGVVFQWSSDDGETWNNLGEFLDDQTSTGKGWYNADGITAQVAVQGNPVRDGWAGGINGWVTGATHSLTGEQNIDLSVVRFRFAFASRQGDKDEDEGFAFDNFTLFSREKISLVETFSSTLSSGSIDANEELVAALQGSLAGEVVWVNYFTDLEGEDVLHASRPVGPNARTAFYSIESLPRAVLGGEKRFAVSDSEDDLERLYGLNTNQIQIESLDLPEFSIQIQPLSIDDDKLTVVVNFVAGIGLEGIDEDDELSFRIMVLQSEIPATFIDDGNVDNTAVFRNVLRAILPGAEGVLENGPVRSGDQFIIGDDDDEDTTWEISGLFGADGETVELRVVAFVQNEITKEVYQVATSTIDYTLPETVTGVATPFFDEGEAYELYPNPADQQLNIKLMKPANEDLNWSLYDQSGREVERGVLRKGQFETAVDTREMRSGLYLLKLFNASYSWETQRVIIYRNRQE